jgi:hypothetical protein
MSDDEHGPIRQLVSSALTAEELNDLCIDHFPAAHDDFTEGQTKSQRVRLLVSRGSAKDIVDQVRVVNPNAVRLYEQQRERLRPATPPPSPSLFLGRDRDLDRLRLRITESRDSSDMPPGRKSSALWLTGWPGIGKTSLAITLANDPDLQKQFSDGIIWASLGQEPAMSTVLAEWAGIFDAGSILDVARLDAISQRTRMALNGRNALLIIDDVWHAEHAMTVEQSVPETCRLLLTTRFPELAASLASSHEAVIPLKQLDMDDALNLLSRLAPDVVSRYRNECRELADELECLPLSLQVAGRLLGHEARLGLGVRELINELQTGKSLLEAQAPPDRFDLQNQTIPTVSVLLEQSVSLLDPGTRECFAFLGPFAPKPAVFELEDMQAVWEIDDPVPIVRELVSYGLLEPLGDGLFQMHALLKSYAESLLDD